jgi:hypothetical protein
MLGGSEMKLFYHWVNVTIIVIIFGLLGLVIGLMCGCYDSESQCEVYDTKCESNVVRICTEEQMWRPAIYCGSSGQHCSENVELCGGQFACCK